MYRLCRIEPWPWSHWCVGAFLFNSECKIRNLSVTHTTNHKKELNGSLTQCWLIFTLNYHCGLSTVCFGGLSISSMADVPWWRRYGQRTSAAWMTGRAVGWEAAPQSRPLAVDRCRRHPGKEKERGRQCSSREETSEKWHTGLRKLMETFALETKLKEKDRFSGGLWLWKKKMCSPWTSQQTGRIRRRRSHAGPCRGRHGRYRQSRWNRQTPSPAALRTPDREMFRNKQERGWR